MDGKVVLVVSGGCAEEVARALAGTELEGVPVFSSPEEMHEALAQPEPKLVEALDLPQLEYAQPRPPRAYVRLEDAPRELPQVYYQPPQRCHPYTARDLRRQERGRGRRVTR